ncbi:MAG: galactokinase [Lachnospiraceae bacterium]
MKQELIQKFNEIYGEGGELKTYFAPGRVNLIGEHTDYNGGHVFPCALTIGTYGVFRKRNDRTMRFYSVNFPKAGVLTGSLDELKPRKEAGWSNYPVGMVWTFGEKGHPIDCGFDMLIYGTIPDASGLSSSSSVHMLTAVALRDMYGVEGVSNIDIALYGQFAENNFNGVNCGIMDQFAISMGKKDNAIYLDTSNLEYEYAPIRLDGMKIVIACSNKKRGLGDSKYNERRAECEEALAELQKVVDIKALGDLTEEEFEKYKDAIGSEVRMRRARHAVYENQRTKRAVEVLKAGDVAEFGRLMNASHVSLRDDYEVTGKELDTLVDTAWKQDGVIGSRMTGAGFGGCTVSIVKEDAVKSFIENVGKIYEEKIGYKADFYVVEIGDGAGSGSNTVNIAEEGKRIVMEKTVLYENIDRLVQYGLTTGLTSKEEEI